MNVPSISVNLAIYICINILFYIINWQELIVIINQNDKFSGAKIIKQIK